MMKKFDEIKVGDVAKYHHKITQVDIDDFIELTGDDNRLHTEGAYASKTIIKKPIVHGMLGASFISTLIGTKLPGDGALWTSQQLDFLAPVRVGDEITIVAEVIKKIKRDKSIELKTEIYNQHKKKVTSGKAAVRVLEPANRNVKKDRRRKRRKVALVMGGTGDIGQEVALGLARDDFSVVIQYRNNRKVATSLKRKIEKNGGECYIVWADMMEERSLEEIVGSSLEEQI